MVNEKRSDAVHDAWIQTGDTGHMTDDYIQAWQCIGCGKIEAPQTCIGVCRDRKVFMVGKDDHERVLAETAALQERLDRAYAMLLRFGQASPREGQWENSWNALQLQVRETLTVLRGVPGNIGL